MPSGFSQPQLAEYLTPIFGESLSNTELEQCIRAIEFVEPPIAKQFWQSTIAQPGIYLILTGKVRLLDISNNLITTLSPGASFGEMTLFPEADFIPYVARASVKLKLGFLGQEILSELFGFSSSIRDCLLTRAEHWNLLLLCCQNS